ncbi:MAG: S8 family peptidase [Bacteroidetes bacterium]|nr:S8 family peptidase [Bacteroidota bacterium]
MAVCRLAIVFLAVWFTGIRLHAQADRHVVYFKDKNNSPYSVQQPGAFLSERSIKRRAHSGIAVLTEDLPVNPTYVSQVHATGARTYFTSRWMNVVLVEATPAQITSIAALPFVQRTELVAPDQQLLGGRMGKTKNGLATPTETSTDVQLNMLGLDKMHIEGFRGNGIMIAVFDAGFPGINTLQPFQSIFDQGRMIMTKDYVYNSNNVYQYNAHGTEVLSVMAANNGMGFVGGADAAAYLLFVTEDYNTEYRIEEFNWLFAAEKADSAGADIIQASLGYNFFDDYNMDYAITSLDGKSAVVSKAAGFARDRGMIVCVSAGNEGTKPWHYITPPADVDGILATGAVTASLTKASFSSFGPTADGRIKPDVMALGSNAAIMRQDGSIALSSGTSFASPLVASLAAGLLQAYPGLKPAQLVQIIRSTASKSAEPDNSLGYGIPHYLAVKNYMTVSELNDDIFLFPNPSVGSVFIGFATLPLEPVSLVMTDLAGRTVMDTSVLPDWQNNPLEIPLSNLASGLYVLKVSVSGKVNVMRFLKM